MKNERLFQVITLVVGLTAFGVVAAQAGKETICHFPPGNPTNFHTIVVSDKAVAAHVAKHNDLVGSCLDNCEIICDDGDFCTQDVLSDPDQCTCTAEPRSAVDCNDSNECTADSCDSDIGACLNNAAIVDGEACDDGTGSCSDGVCGPANTCPTTPCTAASPYAGLEGNCGFFIASDADGDSLTFRILDDSGIPGGVAIFLNGFWYAANACSGTFTFEADEGQCVAAGTVRINYCDC